MSHLKQFAARLFHDLDDFQIAGCEAVEADRGVLVCAPTGAGKTIVGEFAVSLALSRGTKCFYTTPIKALSNQKFHDLVAVHGEDAVGLLTGDQSINPEAEVVVMTTEVLRNMIYAESTTLNRLTHVVMDEIHFLADQDRGAVWEEVILNLDDSVNIIGLSATVSNSEEFGRWLTTVRGDTEVIVSEHRPVPLDQWMMVGPRVYELFEGDRVNGQLLHQIGRIESSHDRYKPMGRPEVLEILRRRGMLPAIVFIFSRAGCDGAVQQCHRARLVLTTQEESDEIVEIVNKGVEDIPEEDLEILRFKQWRSALSRGFAAHHAGMLPAFRHIVEELFTKGLLKAVFATETLALGINMPARTVVLERLVKFNGEAHVDLTPGQYTQLTGRAGRRGIDTIGNAVVQWAPAMDPKAVAGLASTRTYPLNSTFTPGYNMAINLLAINGREESLRLLEKSFAQFQADGSIVGDVREIERDEEKLAGITESIQAALERLAVPGGLDDLVEYVELRQELSHAEREAKRQAISERGKEAVAVLARLQVGDVIALPGRKSPQLAVVVTPANQSKDPRPWVTTERGWSGRIDGEIGVPPIVVGQMHLPKNVRQHPRRGTKYVVNQFKRNYYKRPKNMKVRSRIDPTFRSAVVHHPVHAWPNDDRELLVSMAQEYSSLDSRLSKRKERIETATDTLGRTFSRILDLLEEMDYVEDGATVTDEGLRLAQIHNVSDLLVAQALKRGIWDELDPAELAGVVSSCAFENRKATHSSTDHVPTENMAEAMNATYRIWAELAADEQRHRLPVTREPEAEFVTAMHQWTAGAPLAYCLEAASYAGTELTPGDFVRSVLQTIDLLEQVAKTAYSEDTKRNARRAIAAARRGVVALST